MKVLLVAFLLAVLLPLEVFASANSLDQINQRVSDRFESDVSKLAAIMEEVRSRKGIKETRVAFGGIDTNIKAADYQITYAAEAIAFQRAQKFQSQSSLRNSLEVLKNKILQAKKEVGKALDE